MRFCTNLQVRSRWIGEPHITGNFTKYHIAHLDHIVKTEARWADESRKSYSFQVTLYLRENFNAKWKKYKKKKIQSKLKKERKQTLSKPSVISETDPWSSNRSARKCWKHDHLLGELQTNRFRIKHLWLTN